MASNVSNTSPAANQLVCPYHPAAALVDDYHTGDMICSDCGLIVGDRMIDPSSEWRTFSDDPSRPDPSRVGSTDPVLQNLATFIQPSANGFEPPNHFSFLKMDTTTRKLMFGFAMIATMAERINAPASIVSHAKTIFKQALEPAALTHRSLEAVSVACLYIACRQEGVPRTFKEMCAVCSASKKEIGRCFKLITKVLATSLDHITSEDFMQRFCSKLFLPHEVQKAATHIAQKAFEADLVPDRSPISVAAAAIYMASQVSATAMSLKAVAAIAGVAELTIKQSYKLMHPHAWELFPRTHLFYKHIGMLPSWKRLV